MRADVALAGDARPSKVAVALALCLVAGCSAGAVPGSGRARATDATYAEADACLAPLVPAGPMGPAGCPASPPVPDVLDRILARLDLTRCDLTIPAERVERLIGSALAHDRFRLPFFDAVHAAPLRLPAFARETVAWLDGALASPAPTSRAIQAAALRLGYDVGEVCPFDPPAPRPAPLAAALAEVIRAGGGRADAAALAEAAASVPTPLQAAIAWILVGAAETARAREAAIARVSPETRAFLFHGGPDLLGLPGVPIPDRVQAAYWDAVAGETFDYRTLYRAAARLARTIEVARLERFAGLRAGPFWEPTPWGAVVVGGPRDDVYDPDPGRDDDVLLLVDTGGRNTYRIPVGATRSLRNPVSLAVDLGRAPEFGYVEKPDPRDGVAPSRPVSDRAGRDPETGQTRSEEARQGAGRLGVGLLYHLGGGHGTYRSLRRSQGYGQLGVGVLYDSGGDGVYRAEALAQGAAIAGIGLLVARGGGDRYSSYVFSQGFGYVKGAGVLLNHRGQNRYEVNVGDPEAGGDPVYPAPQAPGRSNASLSQGAGFGRRPDSPGGVSASGGLGVLRSRGGGNVYLGSVFAQGSGYWFGTGIFQDGGGSAYDGFWYVQGTAAHMGLGWFAAESGHNRYNQVLIPKGTSLGVGHDLAVAIHVDEGGLNVYRGGGLTFGAGSAQGLGLFVGQGGDNVYDGSASSGFGSVAGDLFTGARATEPTFGLFVTVGGGNVYRSGDRPPGVASDAVWEGRSDRRYARGAARGIGADAGAGAVRLP